MNSSRSLSAATLGALGVVYGDIGTSPLYALREATAAAGGPTPAAVLGVVSLIFWSLLLVISLKYVVLILRADNDGEGGILSLVALVQRHVGDSGAWAARLVALGVLGTALFYCDALLTPAISVLSAVEGLEILDARMQQAVMPATIAILAALFALQRRGTARVGRLFGPVMVLWFGALAAMGLRAILAEPGILAALDPLYGLALLALRPGVALAILGAVFLVVTGGEALYADMGHFGRAPVRLAWFAIVWPGLLLNYFGQGALLLAHPTAAGNPFFKLAPGQALPALITLATAATVIASQATLSGAFSITRQAVQLDLLPRVKILQTSPDERGQIYVPATNAVMFVAVIAFVLGFGSSSALSGAYGASVMGTMLITTLLGAVAAAAAWQWPAWRIALVFGLFLAVDLAFVAGNASKIPTGGWVPLTLAAGMFALFLTWRDGRVRLRAELQRRAVPTALLRNFEHNRVCHEHIVILHLDIQRSPREDAVPRGGACGSRRTAPSSSAGTWCARGRGMASRASGCGSLPGCSGAAPRPRSSSACRPGASSCSRPRSRSSLPARAPRRRSGR